MRLSTQVLLAVAMASSGSVGTCLGSSVRELRTRFSEFHSALGAYRITFRYTTCVADEGKAVGTRTLEAWPMLVESGLVGKGTPRPDRSKLTRAPRTAVRVLAVDGAGRVAIREPGGRNVKLFSGPILKFLDRSTQGSLGAVGDGKGQADIMQSSPLYGHVYFGGQLLTALLDEAEREGRISVRSASLGGREFDVLEITRTFQPRDKVTVRLYDRLYVRSGAVLATERIECGYLTETNPYGRRMSPSGPGAPEPGKSYEVPMQIAEVANHREVRPNVFLPERFELKDLGVVPWPDMQEPPRDWEFRLCTMQVTTVELVAFEPGPHPEEFEVDFTPGTLMSAGPGGWNYVVGGLLREHRQRALQLEWDHQDLTK